MLWPKLPTDRCFRYPLRSLPLSPRPFLLSRLEHRLLCSLPAALAPGVDSQQVLPAGSSWAVLDGSFHQVGGTLFRKVPQEQVASQSCPLALRTERCQWLGPWSVPSGAGLEAAGNTNAACHQAGRAGLRGLGRTAGFLTRRWALGPWSGASRIRVALWRECHGGDLGSTERSQWLP